MICVLSFRDETRDTGGAVFGGQLQRWSEDGETLVEMGRPLEAKLAAQSHVTFLIHGFNVKRTEGRKQLLEFAHMLEPKVGGALVSILWPGDHFVGPLSFSWEGDDADDTASNLARYVSDILVPGTPLSFVTHSLGARVALEAMNGLLDQEYPVKQVCLLAAAVDDDSLAHEDVYREATEGAGRVGLLHSRDDAVLRFAYPAGDALQAFLFFWRDSPGLALGYHGPRDAERDGGAPPDNVIHKAVGEFDVGHFDYLPKIGGGTNAAQRSAAVYAGDLVSGRDAPRYPSP